MVNRSFSIQFNSCSKVHRKSKAFLYTVLIGVPQATITEAFKEHQSEMHVGDYMAINGNLLFSILEIRREGYNAWKL